MAKVFKILLVLVILSGIVVGGYAWIQNQQLDDRGFTLVDVVRGDITKKAVAVGQIEPRQKFHIKSKIPGIVRQCPVDVGDRVKVGDPIIEISPDPTPTELLEVERQVEKALSAFNRAKADWERSQDLVKQGVLTRDRLDADHEAYDLTRIELDRARDLLQLIQEGRVTGRGEKMETIIRATAAGILLERLVDPGDPVVPLTTYQEGTELATLADMSDLIFKGTVDEIDVGKLHVGLPVRLKIGALPDQPITGKLTRIAPQAIERDNAKLFEVEIEMDSFEGVMLRAGYSANADVVIREKRNILLIPERLVIFENEGAKTFVELPGEVPDAEPRKVAIKIGLSDGLNTEVISGVREGQKLIQRPPREIE